MAAENIQIRATSIGFLPVLALIFITLKLMGYIGWSWWWVLAPLWGPFALAGAVVAGAFVIAFLPWSRK